MRCHSDGAENGTIPCRCHTISYPRASIQSKRDSREFLPKERVRKSGEGLYAPSTAPDSNYEKGILIMNEATRTSPTSVLMNLTDVQALIDTAKAALHVAEEAVKA